MVQPVAPVTRTAGILSGLGQVLSGMTQGEEMARKRQMEQVNFAMRLAELNDRRTESQERLRMAREARENRLYQKNAMAEAAKLALRQGGIQNNLSGLAGVAASTIPSSLDTDEGPSTEGGLFQSPPVGPLTRDVASGMGRDIGDIAAKRRALLYSAFPEQAGKSLLEQEFRKPDTLSPEREAQMIRIAQGSRPAASTKPARVVTVRMPNGKEQSFREDDPNLDRVIAGGGVKVTAPLMKFPGEMEKNFAKQYEKLSTESRAAGIENAKLDALDALLDKVTTGAFAGAKQSFWRAIKGIGFKPEDFGVTDTTGAADAAIAIQNRFALNLRSPQGTEGGLTGQTSDADREFLVQSVGAGLTTTREGRKLMIEFTKRLNNQRMELARQARAYIKKHGQLDVGWDEFRDNYVRTNRVFGPEDVKRVEAASRGEAAPATPQPRKGPGKVLKFDSQGNRIR